MWGKNFASYLTFWGDFCGEFRKVSRDCTFVFFVKSGRGFVGEDCGRAGGNVSVCGEVVGRQSIGGGIWVSWLFWGLSWKDWFDWVG